MPARAEHLSLRVLEPTTHPAPARPHLSPHETPTANQPEVKRDLEGVPFYGFTEAEADWLRGFIESTGLPTLAIRSLHYRPNQKGHEDLLGTADLLNGDFSLYRALRKQREPEIAHANTALHEHLHLTEPTLFAEAYTSQEAATEAAVHAARVADQSLLTEKYLNGYHKSLGEELLHIQELARNGHWLARQVLPEVRERFCRETHSIMGVERVFNPKHLLQVEEAQRSALERMNERSPVKHEFTQIMGTNRHGEAVGIDRTFLALLPELNGSPVQLDLHLQAISNSVSREESPFANTPQVEVVHQVF